MVWRSSPISRIALAEQTELNPVAITRIVQKLEQCGLVFDRNQRTGARGQPARPLEIAPNGAYSIGVSFSLTTIELCIINLGGHVVAQERRNLDQLAPSGILQAVKEISANLLGQNDIALKDVAGIGFAIPANRVRDEGSFDLSTKPFLNKLHQRNLISDFQAELPYTVWVEVDSHAAVLGELLYGVGRNFDSIFFVNLGFGVGGGIISDRRPVLGSHGNAGMVSPLFPYGAPRPSGVDLIRQLAATDPSIRDFSDLAILHSNENPSLAAWIRRAGRQLQQGLGIAARLLDPACIVVGGHLPDHVNQCLVSEIDTKNFCSDSDFVPKPRVIASNLGRRAISLGAASVPIFKSLFAR